MPRFRDYTAASFQRAHVNVCISVSKICIKVHKAQIEQKRNVVVVVAVVAILRYLGLCREASYLHAGYLMGSNSMTLSKYNKVDWTLLETLKLFDFNIFFIFSAIISLEILVLSSKICFEKNKIDCFNGLFAAKVVYPPFYMVELTLTKGSQSKLLDRPPF